MLGKKFTFNPIYLVLSHMSYLTYILDWLSSPMEKNEKTEFFRGKFEDNKNLESCLY